MTEKSLTNIIFVLSLKFQFAFANMTTLLLNLNRLCATETFHTTTIQSINSNLLFSIEGVQFNRFLSERCNVTNGFPKMSIITSVIKFCYSIEMTKLRF